MDVPDEYGLQYAGDEGHNQDGEQEGLVVERRHGLVAGAQLRHEPELTGHFDGGFRDSKASVFAEDGDCWSFFFGPALFTGMGDGVFFFFVSEVGGGEACGVLIFF